MGIKWESSSNPMKNKSGDVQSFSNSFGNQSNSSPNPLEFLSKFIYRTALNAGSEISRWIARWSSMQLLAYAFAALSPNTAKLIPQSHKRPESQATLRVYLEFFTWKGQETTPNGGPWPGENNGKTVFSHLMDIEPPEFIRLCCLCWCVSSPSTPHPRF